MGPVLGAQLVPFPRRSAPSEAEQHLGPFVSQASWWPAQTCPGPWCFPPSLHSAGSSRTGICTPLAAPGTWTRLYRPQCTSFPVHFGEACRDLKDIAIKLYFPAKKVNFNTLHLSLSPVTQLSFTSTMSN